MPLRASPSESVAIFPGGTLSTYRGSATDGSERARWSLQRYGLVKSAFTVNVVAVNAFTKMNACD